MPTLRLKFFGFLLATLLFVLPALALNPNLQITQYGHTAWRTQDGVFSGAPQVIAQTTDGYLWIGTNIGLVRFDGVRFVAWNPAGDEQLPDPRVLSLIGTRDGSLWIGTGAGLSRLKDNALTNYPQIKGRIESLLEDPSGFVWLVRTQTTDTLGPLCRIKGPEVQCYGPKDGFPLALADLVASTGTADLWIAGYAQLCRWRPGSSELYFKPLPHHPEGFASLRAIAPAQDGSIWAVIENSAPTLRLDVLKNGISTKQEFPDIKVTNSEVIGLFVDTSNALWISTAGHGIYRLRDGHAEHFGSADGLSSDATSNFFQDSEGTVWVVTSDGIDNFRDLPVPSYTMREGLSAAGASSLAASRDGTVWIGNFEALDFLRDGRLNAIRDGKGLPGKLVTTVFEDHLGRLWVGLDTGLWVYDHKSFHAIRHRNGSSLGTVFTIAEDTANVVWVRAGKSLDRIEDLNLREETTSPQIAAAYIMAADPTGGIVLGLVDGEIVHERNGNFSAIAAGTEENRRHIRDLLVEQDGSVWGTSLEMLSRWKDGRRENLTQRNGLPCDGIFGMVKDDAGTIWLYTRCGLVELQRAELDRWWAHPDSVLKVKVLDEQDGVRPGLTSLKPQAVRTPDGRLWFVNGRILQMFDEKQWDRDMLPPPPVHIEETVADRQTYLPVPDFHLPALTHDVEMNYTAPSFASPRKVLFRYKLEGHDVGWQEPGTRRQAFYNNLSPGTYTFRVIASNSYGVWSQHGAALTFTVDAAYYQTPWFRTLLAVTAIGILWALYLLRLQYLTEQLQARLGERLVERERIARELHDTLLQGFQGLLLRFQAVMKTLPPESASHQKMEEALDRADEVLLEGRQRVRDLRSEGTTDTDLPESLARCGKELTQDYATPFELTVTGTPRPLDPSVWQEVYRIGREAMTNAFRHAAASKIEAELTYLQSGLRVTIRDNGHGIEPEILNGGRAGHWGLSGMRERAERIGGQLNIWSQQAGGTEVDLTVPGKVAYPKLRRVSQSKQ
jgi:signal transduction histidine kinase/ligand-binding sensor domain-containing protein